MDSQLIHSCSRIKRIFFYKIQKSVIYVRLCFFFLIDVFVGARPFWADAHAPEYPCDCHLCVTASGFLMGGLISHDMRVRNQPQRLYLKINIHIYYSHHNLCECVV